MPMTAVNGSIAVASTASRPAAKVASAATDTVLALTSRPAAALAAAAVESWLDAIKKSQSQPTLKSIDAVMAAYE